MTPQLPLLWRLILKAREMLSPIGRGLFMISRHCYYALFENMVQQLFVFVIQRSTFLSFRLSHWGQRSLDQNKQHTRTTTSCLRSTGETSNNELQQFNKVMFCFSNLYN